MPWFFVNTWENDVCKEGRQPESLDSNMTNQHCRPGCWPNQCVLYLSDHPNHIKKYMLEHNKDQPPGDLYPNLQVIKSLEADHDPWVLNPFWSQPAGQTCRFAGDPQVSAGWGTHRYRSSWPAGICIQDSTFYNFINQLCGNLSLQNIYLICCYYIFHGPSKVFLMYIIYQVIIWN